MFRGRGIQGSVGWRNLASALTSLKESHHRGSSNRNHQRRARIAVAAALASPTGHLKLTDDKGKTYIVPTASLGFIEVGNEESRRVGFVA